MIGLSNTQTFTAIGATAAATYPGNGTSAQPRQRAAISVTYDAATQSYAIVAPQASQTFAPSDRVAGLSNANLTTFQRIAGTTTDTLILTNPGTSGLFNYQFVGGGIQSRVVSASGVDDGRFNAFTYGIPAPNTAIPLTGTGTFAITITGMQAMNSAPVRFDGTGLLTADFAARTYSGSGIVTTRLPSVTGNAFSLLNQPFSLNGLISNGTVIFDGSIIVNSTASYTAGISLGFYGPGLQEIGGSFTGQNASNQSIVGVLLGRTGTTAPPLETLESLLTPVSVQALSTGIRYSANSPGLGFNGATLESSFQSELLLNTPPVSYIFGDTLDSSNIVAAESNARFNVYRPNASTLVRIYRAGSGNDELALSYSGFGSRELQFTGAPRIDQFFVFGLETGVSLLPRTGTGIYQGVLYGSGVGAGSFADRFSLTGTANFNFNFAGGTFTGSLLPVAINQRDLSSTNLGTYTFSNGQAPGANAMSNAFFGDIIGIAGATGRINGRFYGPNSQEVGGAFNLTTPGAGTTLTIAGAVVAKRQ